MMGGLWWAVGGGVLAPASNRRTFSVGRGGRLGRESVARWAPVCHEASVTGGAAGGRASAMPARASGGLWSAGLGENARALADFRHLRERATGHASASLIPIDRLDP